MALEDAATGTSILTELALIGASAYFCALSSRRRHRLGTGVGTLALKYLSLSETQTRQYW
jgi:hypothetical protein